MKKNTHLPLLTSGIIVCILTIQALMFSGCKAKSPKEISFNDIEKGFKEIPDSIQTSVYWYWISDNISKEGVIKDLQAMKKAGINRAFIGNVGLSPEEAPYGKVKIFSDEWWNILHAALKTASDLNIEIGIFNSPGWSQSGGPWIPPDKTMRYLSVVETDVKGPQKLTLQLSTPVKDFQNVRLIAYKVPEGYGQAIQAKHITVTSSPAIKNTANIADGDTATQIDLPAGKTVSFDFHLDKPTPVSSILVYTSHKPIIKEVEIFAKQNGTYKSLKSFLVNRSNPSLDVGFIPYGPVSISFPKTVADEFRIVFNDSAPEGGIAEIEMFSLPKVERYIEKTLAKMHQTPHPFWKDYLWPEPPSADDNSLAVQPKDMIDLTSQISAKGVLTWNVPEGNWKLFRAGMVPTGVTNAPATPEGTGPEVDKMSKENIAFHFNAFLGEIMRRIPPEDRKTWKVCVMDSYETGSQNWTDHFINEFEQEFGYDPVPYIPVFNGDIVGNAEMSERFLWDLRRFIADKVAYNYVGGLRDVSHKHGLTTWLECYGHWGFPGEFLEYGGQSDEVGGEFWSEGDLGDIENKAASSCAHIYGKRKVSAESFTCAWKPYYRYPAIIKQRGDKFFTEGINNTLLHVYIEQPTEDKVPGINAPFGNEFNRHNTWFPYLDLFTQYLKRCNFMLQQGRYAADAAYFIGEDAPKMTGECDPELPFGYSYDYINAEVILNKLSVKNGKLVLPDGISYSILVLPKLTTMRPEVLNKIKKLIYEGAVVLGPQPSHSPSLSHYPESDKEVQKLAGEIWGNVDGIKIKSGKVGKGLILCGMNMQEALDFIHIQPDLSLTKPDSVLFIHRTLPDGDIYFVSNQSCKEVSINPSFRISGKMPEFWEPTTGTIHDLPQYTNAEGRTSVPLKLEAWESQFIIFRKPASSDHTGINFPDPDVLQEIQGPWIVTFDHAMRGPLQPVVFKTLKDWTSSSNDSIKYYSGTAAYKTQVNIETIPQNQHVFIQLGNIVAIAKIKINGQYAGGVWTAPWQLEIGKYLKPGENTIEIEVANTWVNRLIGDLKRPAKERKTWINFSTYTATSPLQSSGLMGPVKIVAYDIR